MNVSLHSHEINIDGIAKQLQGNSSTEPKEKVFSKVPSNLSSVESFQMESVNARRVINTATSTAKRHPKRVKHC